MKTIQIGIMGAGTVGSGVIRTLKEQSELLLARTGLRFEIRAVFDRDWAKKPDLLGSIPASDDPSLILDDPKIDIVIELLGGLNPAGDLILRALERGKSVVTANKALLARRGMEIFTSAREKSLHIGFEAAVAGALPVIKSLRRSLVVNDIKAVYGILNGTCNFIISRMQYDGMDYDEALRLAQQRGFAESDPSFDVNGNDAAQKLALLAGLAFNTFIPEERIKVEGITSIRHLDIELTAKLGWVIRLLAVARVEEGGALLLRVHPAIIPEGHILAHVRDEKNAVFFHTSHSGPTLIMGQGAGSHPTAAAVISDLVFIAKSGPEPELWFEGQHPIRVAEQFRYRFYLRFQTADRPGVLAEIATILANRGISIASVNQQEGAEPVQVLVITHEADEASLLGAIREIDGRAVTLAPTVFLRIMDDL